MLKTVVSIFVTFTTCGLLLGINGCSQKKPKVDEGIVSAIDGSDFGTSDEGKALGLKTIHFAYDTNLLSDEAKEILQHNAEILKAHPSVKLQIEGYCDEQGGAQYNLALGEKRADSTKFYLQDRGIASERLTTISFGKERPLFSGETEEAYAKNRRANFALTSK